jgi:hypothetical protein
MLIEGKSGFWLMLLLVDSCVTSLHRERRHSAQEGRQDPRDPEGCGREDGP